MLAGYRRPWPTAAHYRRRRATAANHPHRPASVHRAGQARKRRVNASPPAAPAKPNALRKPASQGASTATRGAGRRWRSHKTNACSTLISAGVASHHHSYAGLVPCSCQGPWLCWAFRWFRYLQLFNKNSLPVVQSTIISVNSPDEPRSHFVFRTQSADASSPLFM